MPQNSIELLQKLMEKYSRVFMSFAGKQGVPYDDVEDIVMASFWSCYKGGYLEKMTEPEIKRCWSGLYTINAWIITEKRLRRISPPLRIVRQSWIRSAIVLAMQWTKR